MWFVHFYNCCICATCQVAQIEMWQNKITLLKFISQNFFQKLPKLCCFFFSIFWSCVVSDDLFCFSNFHASNEEFRTEFKVPPFQDCVLSFLGFSEEERTNMEERTQKHGSKLMHQCPFWNVSCFEIPKNLCSNNSVNQSLSLLFIWDADPRICFCILFLDLLC